MDELVLYVGAKGKMGTSDQQRRLWQRLATFKKSVSLFSLVLVFQTLLT